MNDTLHHLEITHVQPFDTLTNPVIFMVAPPRSGTTLMYQLLTLRYDLFYPTNLLAKFYKCPYLFLRGIEDLGVDSLRHSSTLTSHLGNTNELMEPHEWGWFWERFFFANETSLKQELSALQSLFPKPMLFKTVYFNYRTEMLAHEIPSCIFLRIRRNAVDTIASMYQAIVARNKPIGSKEHAVHYQKYMHDPLLLAVMEYCYDTKLLDATLANKRVITLSYDDILADTLGTLDDFARRFSMQFDLTLNTREHAFQVMPERTFAMDKVLKKRIESMLEHYESLSLDALEGALLRA